MNDQQNQTDWPLGEASREKDDSWLNHLSARIHTALAGLLSNLRLSLTLRISLHYAGQLLKTTLPMALVLLVVFFAAHVPQAAAALDELTLMQPENGSAFSAFQLAGMPFSRAEYHPEVFAEGIGGIWQRIVLAFSEFASPDGFHMMLGVNTDSGRLVAAWKIDWLLQCAQILFWAYLGLDLFRVVSFLQHRNRLNRKVLKPITDMAEKAATLSATNLNERISVEGAKNELKDLALVINGMLDRIELSYNSQKQFVSDASHELRTPIAVIQGYISMLERWGKTDPEVLEEGISAISQEASSMKELVERLLFLARHDKKTLMLEMESFEPLEVMSEIHREAKMLSGEHCYKLDPAQNVRISGDKDMIKQLMRILLDNAIKYTPAGGSITLGVRREGRQCVLSVTDTGAGISAEELPKIFDRFYRCDDARQSQTSGHGLGLSIARIIVSAHSGKLKVRSKVGAGTTFSVFLPLETDSPSNPAAEH